MRPPVILQDIWEDKIMSATYKKYCFDANGARRVTLSARTRSEAWLKLRKTHEYYFNRSLTWRLVEPIPGKLQD